MQSIEPAHDIAVPSDTAPVARRDREVVRTGTVAGWAWSVAIAVMLVFGGTNPSYPATRHFAELVACGVIAAALAGRASARFRIGTTDVLLIALIVLMVATMIPLPPGLWSLLPTHTGVAAMDEAVFGAAQWRAISLNSEHTLRASLFLLPAIAIYLAVRSGDAFRHEALSRGILIALAIAITMGLGQTLIGEGFYPFSRSDREFSIGFFTNHNHQATFLVMGALVWLARDRIAQPIKRTSGTAPLQLEHYILPVAIVALTALAVLLTASRAGLGLLVFALAAGAWVLVRARLAPGRTAILYAGGGFALLIVSVLALPFIDGGALSAITDRGAIGVDRRFEIWPQAVTVVGQTMPLGSGFGTFREVYEQYEPLSLVGMLYVNHAHNDYLELLIEGGIPAAALLIAFVVWFVRRTWPLFIKRLAPPSLSLFATAIVVAMLHSVVDYPLRTIAVAMLCSYAIAHFANRAAPDARQAGPVPH
ncbi:hypothetical protein HME9302_00896 [Alteripontixanthobacter maritimus]|uniref:O-antigen ligase-related domain-containing protein n=1 Tax=Alteripontixanthobacter maritimus TaxID=2161824 RepID=A0A369Q4P5_9SPHN|nr:O-antigen ligase family protein [Alteripontixanthobacter maritimus]RDC59704.1 hypothetical protein HME9302_00896 [Alteripontixanthobacter maritimus]